VFLRVKNHAAGVLMQRCIDASNVDARIRKRVFPDGARSLFSVTFKGVTGDEKLGPLREFLSVAGSVVRT